jgi:PAS domain-containing protein
MNEEMLKLKNRALEAASEGFSLADMRLSDTPLIYVSSGFERLTGYSAESALGTNSRFPECLAAIFAGVFVCDEGRNRLGGSVARKVVPAVEI